MNHIQSVRQPTSPVLIRYHLPEVIDKVILSFLPAKSLIGITGVNKSWKVLANDDQVWKSVNLQCHFPKLTIMSHKFWPKPPELRIENGRQELVEGKKFAPDSLPRPLTLLFLSYLEPSDLQKVAQVEDWGALGKFALYSPLDLSDIDRPISTQEKRTMIPVIQKLLPLVEGDMGVTILTIPKGLTFNHLVAFAESLVEQHGTIFRYIWQDFREKYGNTPISQTYRVILTNNVLKDSRNKSAQAQKDLIDKLGIGCDFPEVIEMVTLLISTLLNSNNRLFNDHPWTYSRCREIIDRWHACVGAFLAGSGFGVHYFHFDLEDYGLAGRRRLKTM